MAGTRIEYPYGCQHRKYDPAADEQGHAEVEDVKSYPLLKHLGYRPPPTRLNRHLLGTHMNIAVLSVQVRVSSEGRLGWCLGYHWCSRAGSHYPWVRYRTNVVLRAAVNSLAGATVEEQSTPYRGRYVYQPACHWAQPAGSLVTFWELT